MLAPTMSGFGGKADIRAAVSPTLSRAIQALPRRCQQSVAQALGITRVLIFEVSAKDQQFDIAARNLGLCAVQPFPLTPPIAAHSESGWCEGAGGHRGSFVGLFRAVLRRTRRHVLLRSEEFRLVMLTIASTGGQQR